MRRLLLALIVLAVLPVAAAAQDSAPDAGKPFEPQPRSEAQYARGANSATEQDVVKGVDGTRLFVETWLPQAAPGGAEPPSQVPVVLIATPYVQRGVERYPKRNLEPVIEWFNERGYAVAQHHVRGTGHSDGCLEQTSTLQIDDTARVIEHLGTAPWSTGAVGMYGHSYDAETQISVAGRGDRERVQYLKAIVPSASVGGQYEYSHMDGVPFAGQAALSNGFYFASSYLDTDTDDGTQFARRAECAPEVLSNSADPRGDMTPYWRIREYRPEAPNIEAATLWVHGLADRNVQAITVSGFFDRLPASTPKAGLFGQWEHNFPDKHAGVASAWARQDFLPMVTAWYDQHLKGLDTGTDRWPLVQVQGTDGQWRAEAGFPQTGGPVGQLALGPAGALGATAPTGSTTFREGPADTIEGGTRAVFETPVLSAPLHLTGMPVADLWLTTDRPDGHVTAKLEVVGADGTPRKLPGSDLDAGTYGARSLQHLDPMPSGFFQQETSRLAPVLTPLAVPVRFQPIDLHVPAGAKLRMTVAGATSFAPVTVPSGAAAQITLLHDCTHPSALRFLTARPTGPLLDVRETDEADAGPLRGGPSPARTTDGNGLATSAVCGQRPKRPAAFGPKRPVRGTTDAG